MKKGLAVEGFIREDGTVQPMEQYDDTELRGKIQTNTDNISNLDSRVTELEEHGGVEDPTKADKVENATAGNLASLDENGNLQDSGKKPSDFAEDDHEHHYIADFSGSDNCGASVSVGEGEQGVGGISLIVKGDGQSTDYKRAEIDYSNIDNLNRALVTPSSTPENNTNKLITSKAVYDAIATRAPYCGSSISIESDGNGNLPISNGGNAERDLNEFVSNTEVGKLYNIIINFYKPNTYVHSYPGIVYWEISSLDDTVVHIYVGDYHFMATKAEGADAWEQEEFDKFKISSFLETF